MTNEQMNECAGTHYDKDGIETIGILERLMDDPIPVSGKRKFLVACAMKYLLRLGHKGDTEKVEMDLLKAENYIHRARTGCWKTFDVKSDNN